MLTMDSTKSSGYYKQKLEYWITEFYDMRSVLGIDDACSLDIKEENDILIISGNGISPQEIFDAFISVDDNIKCIKIVNIDPLNIYFDNLENINKIIDLSVSHFFFFKKNNL